MVPDVPSTATLDGRGRQAGDRSVACTYNRAPSLLGILLVAGTVTPGGEWKRASSNEKTGPGQDSPS